MKGYRQLVSQKGLYISQSKALCINWPQRQPLKFGDFIRHWPPNLEKIVVNRYFGDQLFGHLSKTKGLFSLEAIIMI